VQEQVIERQVVNLLDKLILPKEVYDWAISYLENASVEDVANFEQELIRLKKRAPKHKLSWIRFC
jgi:hypothetical protein